MERAKLLEMLEKCGENPVPIGLVFRDAGYKVTIRENTGWKKDTASVCVVSGDGRLEFIKRVNQAMYIYAYEWARSQWRRISRHRHGKILFEPARIMSFLDERGKNKIKKLTTTHRYKLKEYDPCVRKTIAAYQLFMYGNKKDIHNPDINVVFKVDVWFINSFPGSCRKIDTTRYTKCTVDLENECIYREWKEGNELKKEIIDADNIEIIMEGIQEVLSAKEE